MSGTLLWAIHLHLVLCSVSVMLNGADRTPYTHHRPLLRSIESPTTAPQGAKDTRFLKLEPHWFGQLGNQIVGIAKAYALAFRWNRTLVIPLLAPSDQSLDRLGAFDVFSESALALGPVRVLSLAQYKRFGRPPKADVCHSKCRCCVRPPRCNCTLRTPRTVVAANPTVILLAPKLAFQNQAGNDMKCSAPNSLFRWLEPAPLIAQEVQKLTRRLAPSFLGVHLRSFHPTEDPTAACARQLGAISWWFTNVQGHKWNPTGQECHMPPALIDCYRDPRAPRNVFLGTDGKSPKDVATIMNSGALRFTPPPAFGPLLAVFVDLFVLAEATVFIGHPLSTFSAVVCSLREARGRTCPNLVPKLHPNQCQRLPEATTAFVEYLRTHPRMPANGTFAPCHRQSA